MGIEHLSRFFNPQSVAVIGASNREYSVGHTLMKNLARDEFSGSVYPVNPNRREVMGMECVGPVRVLGPDCLGFIRPDKGLNASFATQVPPAGNLAFISQSGAICTAISGR